MSAFWRFGTGLGLDLLGAQPLGLPRGFAFPLPERPELPPAEYWLAGGVAIFGETSPAGEFVPLRLQGPEQPDADPSDGDGSISVSSLQGSVLGRYIPGAREPGILALKWKYSADGGCGSGEVIIHPALRQRVQQFGRVSISVDGVRFYTGYISDAPEAVRSRETMAESSDRPELKYKLEGYEKLLEENSAPVGTFTPYDPDIAFRIPEAELGIGDFLDYGASFLDVAERFVQEPIRANAARINQETGAHQIANIDLSKVGTLKQIFEFFARGARQNWGVDADGYLYLREPGEQIQRTLFPGRDYGEIEVRFDYKQVHNIIEVHRKSPDGGSGSYPAAWAKDDTSIRRFGRRRMKPIVVPGYHPEADCQLLADALLQDHAFPHPHIRLRGIPLRSRADRFDVGLYRIVGAPETFLRTIADCETLEGVSGPLFDAGRVSVDQTQLFTGAGSWRIDFETDNHGEELVYRFEHNQALAGIVVWLMARTSENTEIEIGFGETTPFERKRTIILKPDSPFHPVRWAVDSVPDRTTIFGLRLVSGGPGSLWMDSLGFEVGGYRSFDQRFLEAEYRIDPRKGRWIEAEFGAVRSRWAAPVMSLLNTADELRVAVETE